MKPTPTLIYLIISLTFSNYIFAQKNDFTAQIGINQNLKSERSSTLLIGLSHKIDLKYLHLEFGIKLLRHKMKSSSSSNFGVPNQIGEHYLIIKLINEEISTLEYSSIPVGIALNLKKDLWFGIGIQPMLQINQTRQNNFKLVNIYDEIANTESTNKKIDFTSYNLEFYSYIKVPIYKKVGIILNYSRGIIKIKEKRDYGDYVGIRTNFIRTRRISVGLSYSIN